MYIFVQVHVCKGSGFLSLRMYMYITCMYSIFTVKYMVIFAVFFSRILLVSPPRPSVMQHLQTLHYTNEMVQQRNLNLKIFKNNLGSISMLHL